MSSTFDAGTLERIRAGRGKFAAMAAAYGLGVFNDSFYRESAMLLALAFGMGHMQGWVMAIFTLPYLVFASPAGWLADRFAKRHVVIGAKVMELAAMLLGAVGILTGNWIWILTMAFAMGLQSCVFSPALNGSIPELYPDVYVTRANATLKVVVTVLLLAGVAVSGLAMSLKEAAWHGVPAGRVVVALAVVGVAVLGLAASFGVPRRPAASPRARFPWAGPLETWRQLRAIRGDSLLSVIVAADAFVWFVGALLIPLMNVLATVQFGCGEHVAGYLVATELIGVAVGGFISGRVARGERWHRVLAPGALGLAVTLGLTGVVPLLPAPWRLPVGFALLGLAGMMGGIMLIPCEAFVQRRPAADVRGRVIAAANFVIFCGIFVSGPVANLLNAVLPATGGIAVVGVASLPVALWLWRVLGKGAPR